MDEGRLRAVICDDEPSIRRVVATLVQDCGFDVVGEASLALEALVLSEMTEAHVLVLDLSLQGLSGTDVIPAIKSAAPGTAIVVYTAYDTMAELARQEGVVAVVLKHEPEKLEHELRAVAARHHHISHS